MKTDKHCKIKDSSINFELNTIKVNKIGRTIVNVKQFFKRLVNAPQRTKIVRVSNHISGAKELKHNILTEIKCFKGKQIINVKTNIDNRFLKAI